MSPDTYAGIVASRLNPRFLVALALALRTLYNVMPSVSEIAALHLKRRVLTVNEY